MWRGSSYIETSFKERPRRKVNILESTASGEELKLLEMVKYIRKTTYNKKKKEGHLGDTVS